MKLPQLLLTKPTKEQLEAAKKANKWYQRCFNGSPFWKLKEECNCRKSKIGL